MLLQPDPASDTRRHVVTVGVEDYYHVGAFNQLIQQGQWYRFESRVARGIQATLDLLDEAGSHATFFTLGWVADALPELVREIADRGHEVASRGYYHRSIRQMTPEEFRDDLLRSREALQRAAGRRILGHRVAHEWFNLRDLWALDVLAEAGFEYDSSIGPMLRSCAAEPWRRFVHAHHFGDRTLWEFPMSSLDLLGWALPIAGGNYWRQFPRWFMEAATRHWIRRYTSPFVLYFHTWELDPQQPRIGAASRLQHIRQYRNLERMPDMVRSALDRHRFTSIAEYLGLSVALPSGVPPLAARAGARPAAPVVVVPAAQARTPVTVVVPCFNEEIILPYLANTLDSVERELGATYDLRYLFIDDCSSDGTNAALHRIFGTREQCTVIRHVQNGGVAAAIQTGIRAAETEIVCSIDCDCTYDPHMLGEMIPRLTDGVDLVTASPYHPEGGVRNVPEWRLALSRGLSALYRRLLHHKLYTYTSCFRVYRRTPAAAVTLTRRGFLGVMEMLGRMDLAGCGIREHPTVLEVRMLGRSKMKVLRTIWGHLGLYAELARLRMAGSVPPLPRATPERLPGATPTADQARV
jgi:polysaccharide deacetylase family protein (PEP-CTERM system associated)